MTAPVIAFLSDYGLHDEFVGICHGVIARRCPAARVIDLTHAIPRHDVRAGKRHRARYASTFADVAAGEMLLYEDAERMAALAVNRGSAAAALGARRRRVAAAPGVSAPAGGALGHPRVHLRLTTSTNDRARELALAGAPHGTLVTAAAQTAGRGRQGRRWSAPPGSSLLMSLLLRPATSGDSHAATPMAILPLAAAVAVCDVAGPEALIKWPNDIVLERPPAVSRSSPGSSSRAAPSRAGPCSGSASTSPCALAGSAGGATSQRRHARPRTRGDRAAARRAARGARATPRRRRPRSTLAAWRARDALRGREIAWSTAAGAPRASTTRDGCSSSCPAETARALAAGEVHLGDLERGVVEDFSPGSPDGGLLRRSFLAELAAAGLASSAPARLGWPSSASPWPNGLRGLRSFASMGASAAALAGDGLVAAPTFVDPGLLARARLTACDSICSTACDPVPSTRRPQARPPAPRRPATSGPQARPPAPRRPRDSGTPGAAACDSLTSAAPAPPSPARPSAAERATCRSSAAGAATLRALAAALVAARAALGEVAQQLARERGRLAGHARARAAQRLLGLRRVGERGREQRGREPAVLLARGVDQPARVARVRSAGGVHEQAQQALGLRPALHGVLLVQLARVLGQAPDPRARLVAAADALLDERAQHDLRRLAALVARPRADHVDRGVERVGIAAAAMSASARRRSCALVLRCTRGDQDSGS